MQRIDSRRTDLTGIRRAGYLASLVALLASLLLLAACGGGGGGAASGGEEAEPAEETMEVAESPEETVGDGSEEGDGGSSEEVALNPANAKVGPNENASMLPAGGKAKDDSQPPPASPPEGVRTYPATTNRTDVDLPISYEQDPPTNGDHASYWQNCGFYGYPVENDAAVHSMDHGAVWLTYNPDLLPPQQAETLRGLAREDYVLVSAYPGLRAPLVATAWRNQLDLEGAEDPRLRQFVDQFRVSETAPLSGNGCTGGRGEPEA